MGGVLLTTGRREPPVTTVTRSEVFTVVDAGFAHRRKALRASLRELAGSAEASSAALAAAGIDPLTRGEQLVLADFVRLTEALVATTGRAVAPGAGR